MEKRWKEKNPERYKRNADAFTHRRRVEIIRAYGGKCVCCGEDNYEFLAVDHEDGGGTQHRNELRKFGSNFYSWLRQNGYPKDGYRLLCHNCNMAKGFYGYCPHEKAVKAFIISATVQSNG